eukprot:415019_1
MSDLTELRAKSKRLFNKYLFEIFNSDYYQNIWKQTICSKKQFTIVQITSKYKPQIVNIISYCFSLASNGQIPCILNINVVGLYNEYNVKIDYIINNGLGYCVVDDNDNVIMIQFVFDSCDYPSIDQNTSWNQWTHEDELDEEIKKRAPIFPPLDKHPIKYGEFAIDYHTVVRPDYWGKLQVFKISLLFPVLISMGYKYAAGMEVNPKTFYLLNKLAKQFAWINVNNFNVYNENIKFKNGTLMNDYIDNHKKFKKENINICYTNMNFEQYKKQGCNYVGCESG